MSIGAGIALFAIGAILAFAVNVQVEWVNLDMIGYILMAAGAVIFIVGLVVSGATAIPIPTELETAVRVLGEDLSANGLIPDGMAVWLRTLGDGIRETSVRAPFMFYGTDWLAFGHFMIALAFAGALRDPVRNRWLYRFGMIACAAVPIVGIPYWRPASRLEVPVNPATIEARAAATAACSCARRPPISRQGRLPAAEVIREAAEATAES